MQKAIVLLSGGLDSAVCLWMAKEKGWEPHTVTYNFHRRNSKEIEAAQKLANAAGVVEHKAVELSFLRELMDVELSEDNPLKAMTTQVSPAYIPLRNTIFYAIAASWAETIGARWIVGGHNPTDFPVFPDSTPEYFENFNRLLQIGSWAGKLQHIEVVLPLGGMDKVEIVRTAVRLKVPIELTWSCYGRGEKACGACPACTSRLDAFRGAGITDPMKYESKV